MAKIKTEAEKPVEKAAEEIAQVSEVTQPTSETKTENEAIKIETEKQEPKEGETDAINAEVIQDIPENVLHVLKAFCNYPELYVNKCGGAFMADTKPSIRGNAILYKNPFYKSK